MEAEFVLARHGDGLGFIVTCRVVGRVRDAVGHGDGATVTGVGGGLRVGAAGDKDVIGIAAAT